jgi:hypothetical protein
MNDNKYIDQVGSFLCTVKRPPNGWLDETQGGTPFIRIPCIVTEAGEQQHKEIVWRGYLSEKAKPRTVETLIRAFDWNGDWDDLDSFASIEVIIVTEEEEYNGKTMIKAKWPTSGHIHSSVHVGALHRTTAAPIRALAASSSACWASGGM